METQVNNWKVVIGHDPNRPEQGYFENQLSGTEGELTFEGKTLVDYDGVFELPKSVILAIRQLGFIVEPP